MKTKVGYYQNRIGCGQWLVLKYQIAISSDLQGKSDSARHIAMQFSLVGSLPFFLMFCSRLNPSTDSKVQALLHVAEGKHSFWT